MEIEAIESALADNLDDTRFWSVYGDALLSVDPDSMLARAIAAELRGEPSLPGDSPQAGAEVEWWMGHWRAARFGPELSDPTELLSLRTARLLRHIIAHTSALPTVLPAPFGRAPRTLVRLDLYGRAAPLLVEPATLRELRAAGTALQIRRADRLVHLDAASIALATDALPALRSLVLRGDLEASAEALRPERLPALERLSILSSPSDLLLGILASPLGGSLARLEIAGHGDLDFLREVVRQNPHITVVVDGHLPPEAPRGVLSRRPDHRGMSYLSLAEPGTPLQLARAIESLLEGLEIRVEPTRTLSEWRGLPSSLAQPLARALAARIGLPVYLMRYDFSHDPGSEERAERLDLQIETIALWPDGDLRPVSLPIGRAEIYYESESDEDDVRGAEELLVEQLWEDIEVEEDALYIPAGFRLDPYDTAQRAKAVPVEIQTLDGARPLDPELGAYIVWRAQVLGLLSRQEPPDLSRWTERLLRRHRLDRPPDDPGHPYFADWQRATLEERTRAPSGGGIAGYKLRHEGTWILSPPEGELLISALTAPIDGHRPPAAAAQCQALALWLGPSPSEITLLVAARV